jgi:uncharacterized damage-inducible protein DinB
VPTLIDVVDLLDYNETVRHRYFKALSKLPWKELTKNREASFHSIRNVFVHILSAIDYWLDFLQKENVHSKKDYDKYTTLKEVKTFMEHVEKRTHEYLEKLSDRKFDETCTVKDDSGKIFKITAEDVLIHVFEEEVHHRGELNALLWQMGINPPSMGWKGL